MSRETDMTIGMEDEAAFGRNCLAPLADALSPRKRDARHILGDHVERLEREIEGAASGATSCVALAGGFSAAVLTLKALGVSRHDRVIVDGLCSGEMLIAIRFVGAEPKFVDVDFENRSPAGKEYLTALDHRCRVVCVSQRYSLYLDLSDMLSTLPSRLRLVEDCADCPEVILKNRGAGDLPDASIHALSRKGAVYGCGDAALVITRDPRLARTLNLLRNHGQVPGRRFYYEAIGFNSRVDTVNAEVILASLGDWRRRLGKLDTVRNFYLSRFAQNGDERLRPMVGVSPDASSFYVLSERAACAHRYLEARGIESRLGPVRDLDRILEDRFGVGASRQSLRRSWAVVSRMLQLPFHAGLSELQLRRITDALQAWREKAK